MYDINGFNSLVCLQANLLCLMLSLSQLKLGVLALYSCSSIADVKQLHSGQ